MKLEGSATAEGTERFRKRFEGKIPSGHFRQSQGLWLSSIGIGTYLGNHDAETDKLYHDAIVRAVESGCNVIDTAINYRSERAGVSGIQSRRDRRSDERRLYSLRCRSAERHAELF
jgi:hypothetical protein